MRFSRDRGCLCCCKLDTWLGIFTEMWLEVNSARACQGPTGVFFLFIVHSQQQSEFLQLSPVITLYIL